MGNLVNFIEFAKVGELRHEEEYCLSTGILGILSFHGKGWLPSTLLALFYKQSKFTATPLPVMLIHKQLAI